MKQVLLDNIQKQGLSFLLLAAFVWYFHGQNNQLQDKVDICNNSIVDCISDENELLRSVVENNTRVMKDFSKYLKKAQNKNDQTKE